MAPRLKRIPVILIQLAVIVMLLLSPLVLEKLYKKTHMVNKEDEENTVILRLQTAKLHGNANDPLEPHIAVFLLLTPYSHSSTIQNILMRYALTSADRISIAMPQPKRLSMCYPQKYTRQCPVNRDHAPFDMMFYQLRYDHKEITASMVDTPKRIMLVRDPIKLLREAFHECQWGAKQGLNIFEEYMVNRYAKEAGLFDYEHGVPYRNMQLFMLGVNPSEFNSGGVVRRALDVAVGQFDLVMIHERLLESLILLRHTLDWEYEDLVSFDVCNNSTISSVQEYNKDVEDLLPYINETIAYYNSGDQLLYNLMYQRFDERIKSIDAAKLKAELDSLKSVIAAKRAECLEGEQEGVSRTKLVLSSSGQMNEYCQLSVANEKQITDLIKHRAADRTRHGR